MALNVVEQIGKFRTFRLDLHSKRIVNLKFQEDTDIDEFLDIQYLLDKNKIQYRFDKNFDIQII